MIRACAFDLGNTLSDDTALYDKTLARVSQLFQDRRVIEDRAQFAAVYDRVNRTTTVPFVSHTFGEVEMFRATFDELAVTAISPEEGLRLYRDTIVAYTTLEPAIRAGLEWLGRQNLRRAILSNERSERVERWLSATVAGELFDVVFVSEAAGVEKPERGFFVGAVQEIDVAPNELLMFGDNTIADGACKLLGIPFVHASAFSTDRWYFERGDVHEPDYILPDITPESLRRCLEHFDAGRTFA